MVYYQRRYKIRTEGSVKRNENELSLLHTKASNAVLRPLQGKLKALRLAGARGLRWPESGPELGLGLIKSTVGPGSDVHPGQYSKSSQKFKNL